MQSFCSANQLWPCCQTPLSNRATRAKVRITLVERQTSVRGFPSAYSLWWPQVVYSYHSCHRFVLFFCFYFSLLFLYFACYTQLFMSFDTALCFFDILSWCCFVSYAEHLDSSHVVHLYVQTPTQYSDWRKIKAKPKLSNVKLNESSRTIVEIGKCFKNRCTSEREFDACRTLVLLSHFSQSVTKSCWDSTPGPSHPLSSTSISLALRFGNRDHEPTCEGEPRPSFLEMSFLKKKKKNPTEQQH